MTRPKPGDRVHLTLAAVVDQGGRYYVDYSKDLTISTGATFPVHSASWYHPDAPCIVRVEPAPLPLPTGLGAVVRSLCAGREIVAVRTVGSSIPWRDLDGEWYDDDQVSCVVEVLSPGIELDL